MPILFSGVSLVFEVIQERDLLGKCWQFPILFYRRVSRFRGVSDKSGALLLLPCCIKMPLLTSKRPTLIHFSDFF